MNMILSSIKYVSYIRVSTIKQEISGLGLQSQRDMVKVFVSTKGELLAEYVEIESGKNNARIELAKALRHCQDTRATLVIAKLDRLSRNAAFLMQLKSGAIDFVCCDMPEASNLVIGIMAVMAEYERELIGERTKAALKVLKEQGVKMGGAAHNKGNGFTIHGMKTRAKSLQIRKANARKYRETIYPLIYDYKYNEDMNLGQIAERLKREHVATLNGKTCNWTALQVHRILIEPSFKQIYQH